jgi:hypothetical protein
MMTFGEFGRRSRRPDRFPDPSHGLLPYRTNFDEAAPRRNDARRIGANLLHVCKRDSVARIAQPLSEGVDLAVANDYEHRFIRAHTLFDEWKSYVDELVLARVEERLMPKTRRGSLRERS